MTTLVYENREGKRWRVRECVAHPLLNGFWFGMREDGRPVCVHEHRVKQVETEQKDTEGTKG